AAAVARPRVDGDLVESLPVADVVADGVGRGGPLDLDAACVLRGFGGAAGSHHVRVPQEGRPVSTEETRDIAVEARTLAREAHNRIGGLDEAIIAIRTDISNLRDAVSRLKGQAALFAAMGAVVGSGAVGVGLHYLR